MIAAIKLIAGHISPTVVQMIAVSKRTVQEDGSIMIEIKKQYSTSPVSAFGDFSYYNIGDRGVRSFAELKELFAGKGMVGFVAKECVDGKLVLAEAVQILKMGA